MEPLTEKGILFIKRKLKDAPQPCPVFAAERKKLILVTNGSVLLEWPAKLVDTNCPAFSKLLDNQQHKLAVNHVEGLTKRPWPDTVFNPEAGEFFETEESEPNKKEMRRFLKDTPEGEEPYIPIIYTSGTERVFYHPSSFDIVEQFVPRATYRLWRRRGDEIYRALGVFEGETLVGALANDRP